jgi:hypothetical protein
MDEFAALVQSAVLANDRWHETPGDEYAGNHKHFLRLQKDARQVELLRRFPDRARLISDRDTGTLSVKLVVPLWVTTRSGQPRLVHFAGHFPRHAMVEWMTEDSVNALLQERGDSE